MTKKNKNSIEEKIDSLKKEINKWNNEYYSLSKPSVTDEYYDSKLKELKTLEIKFNKISPTSPTQLVGKPTQNIFTKTKHENRQMLSLDNAFSNNDLIDFENRIFKLLKLNENEFLEYSVEPKIDGLSISLIYENGKLIKAITRGDGEFGELVTQNILQIEDIPKTISLNKKIELRGEIYLSKKNFENINKAKELKNEQIFANARNAASGTLRQLNPEIVKERKLESFFYSIFSFETKKEYNKTQFENLSLIEQLGFKVPPTKKVSSINNVIEEIKNIVLIKNSFLFDIDGIVVKLNNCELYEQLGSTSKFPRWAIAYKFPSEVKTSKLLKIFTTVGRTGLITYNAEIEKVPIMGTMVSFATLHNFDYISKLDLRINDIVEIKKAGDIIPKIIGYIDENNSHNKLKKTPKELYCPSCNSLLNEVEGEVDQYCLNDECKEKKIQGIIHYASRDCMQIEYLGDKQIRNFYNLNLITSIEDIYTFKKHKEFLLTLPHYKEKIVSKIFASIENSKKRNLHKLIFALGIKHIGEKSSLELAKKYKTIDAIINLSLDEINLNSDFGEVKSKSISTWFKDKKNIELLNFLKKNNVNMNYFSSETIDTFFTNKKILITGKIGDYTREDIINEFVRCGAIILSSVSKELDYLIIGKKPSTNKLTKVENDKIIHIEDFIEISKYGK